jgi:predicted ATP-grasp superfamily ATP-dependent carboligase
VIESIRSDWTAGQIRTSHLIERTVQEQVGQIAHTHITQQL